MAYQIKAPKIPKINLPHIPAVHPFTPSSMPNPIQSLPAPTSNLLSSQDFGLTPDTPIQQPQQQAESANPQAPALGNKALETEPSNLEKLLSVLNKPGAIERQIAINAIQGDPLGNKVGDIAGINSNQGVLSNLNNLISANQTYQPSGGDVIKALNGGVDLDGGSTLGKITQGVAGFGLELLNPADPWNWLGFGELNDTGRAAIKIGEDVPFIEGLLNGERSIASLHPFSSVATSLIPGANDALQNLTLHAPEAVNQFAGHTLQGVGDLAQAIPGVPELTKAFTPTFSKLANYATAVTSTARDFVGKTFGNDAQVAADKLFQESIPEVAENLIERGGATNPNHLSQINPTQWAFYKNPQNFPTPLSDKDIVNHELVRKLTEDEPLDTRSSEDKGFVKAVEDNVPRKGPTTPAIQKLADQVKPIYPQHIKALREANLNPSELPDYGPHATSQATKSALENLGIQAKGGGRTSSKSFTPEEANWLYKTAQGRSKLYAKFGTEGFQKSPQALDAFSRTEPKTADFYNFDALQTALSKTKSAGDKIGVATAFDSMAKNPNILRANQADWFGSPLNVERNAAEVNIPPEFQKIYKKNFPDALDHTKAYVPADTAKEFRNFMDIFTDADKANRTLSVAGKAWQGATRLFKEATILSPLGGLHTMFRDNFANNVLSQLSGAWSAAGYKISFAIQKAIIQSAHNPKALEEVLSKLSQKTGLNMEQEYQIIKSSGILDEGFTNAMFDQSGFKKLEKYTGMQAIAKGRNISENQTRLQHYFTRRLQGFSPEGAVKDTRKVLYDYVHGLSPLERRMSNIFPFYAWTRFNIPAMVGAAFKDPAAFGAFYRAKGNIESAQSNKPDERALDEYVKGDPHIRLFQDPKTGNWTYIRLKGFLPQADLEDITSLPKFTDLLEGSLNPLIKTPFENVTNTSTFFKTAGGQPAPIEEYPGQTGKFLGLDLSRKTINVLRDIRPLNEINRLSGLVGGPDVSGKPASLSPVNYGISSLGASLVPVDTQNAVRHAKGAYLRQLSQLKIAKRRLVDQGKNTSQVDSLMQQLSQNSFTPGGQ